MFDPLFKPIALGKHTLKNRIVFGAHTANMSENGYPVERHCAYYEERAIGGAAMIVVEPMPVHRTGVLTRGNFRHDDDAVIPYFKTLVDRVKQHGTVIVQQLYHVGQHGDADLSYEANWSPSGMPSYHDSDGSHAVSESEINELIDGYVNAAIRCQKAGFDGVEVWAQYHSLIDQFWSSWSNKRTDQWGGDLDNRQRISEVILKRIRASCGPDFIIGLSVSYSPITSFVLEQEDILQIVSNYDQQQLIDYVSCGTGSYLDYERVMPTFVHEEKLTVDLATALRAKVKHALVTSESHIRTPDNANILIRNNQADLVSIVRGQIADPHLANKAKAGTPEQIRGCISCNQMCWGRRSRDYWISCLVNPSAGREFEWGGDRFLPAKNVKNMLIVGAGPAGLECARVAASRGHKVTLCEATGELGGQFALAAKAPRRGQILDLMQWYATELDRLNVSIHYNRPIGSEDISAIEPELIVLATGSVPNELVPQRWKPECPELPGLEQGRIWSPEQVFRRECQLGKKVIVLDEGGNWRGLGTAWHLAEKGHQVTLITPDTFVGKELARTTSDLPIRQAIAMAGGQFKVESIIDEWHGDGATVRSMLTGKTERVAADDLVYALTNLAFNDLEHELADSTIKIETIGDCVAPRQAPYAFYEGRKLGLEL